MSKGQFIYNYQVWASHESILLISVHIYFNWGFNSRTDRAFLVFIWLEKSRNFTVFYCSKLKQKNENRQKMWHSDFLRHRGEDRLSLITQTGEGWTLQSAAIFPLPLFMISASSSSSLLLFTWHLMAGLIDFKHLRWLLLAGGSRTGVDHRPASSAGLSCFRGNSISNSIFSQQTVAHTCTCHTREGAEEGAPWGAGNWDSIWSSEPDLLTEQYPALKFF